MNEFQWNPDAGKLRPDEVDSIVAQIFAAPVVDEAQVPMHHCGRVDTPELDLHRAILFDAVTCAVRHHSSPIRAQSAEAQSALRWIESNEDKYFLSFVPICQRFGIDPGWIRRLVRARIQEERSEKLARTEPQEATGLAA